MALNHSVMDSKAMTNDPFGVTGVVSMWHHECGHDPYVPLIIYHLARSVSWDKTIYKRWMSFESCPYTVLFTIRSSSTDPWNLTTQFNTVYHRPLELLILCMPRRLTYPYVPVSVFFLYMSPLWEVVQVAEQNGANDPTHDVTCYMATTAINSP